MSEIVTSGNVPRAKRHRRLLSLGAVAAGLISFSLMTDQRAEAFPQFQEYSQTHSKRTVDCSMCHVNANGPVGSGKGQIDSLTETEQEQLNSARAAMEPGNKAHNPVLNQFGNHIVNTIGMSKVMEAVAEPEKLPQSLGNSSDLDGDGISDGQEFLDGTDPLNKYHGDPFKLFSINLNRMKLPIASITLAVVALNFGLFNLLKYFSPAQGQPTSEESNA